LVLGAAGLAVAVLCFLAVVVRGRHIPPEGKMWEATTFSFGVAVFTLTVALLLPLAGYSTTGRRRWRWAYFVFVVYGYVLEPVQAWRGLDPRFTEAGSGLDVVLGIVFALTALFNTALFVLLGLRFFRADVLDRRPVLRLGIRYGVVAVFLSFAVGTVMIAIKGRVTGDEGNLMLAHGLGVHGLQTVPLVALVLAWACLERGPRVWVHTAGIGWLIACLGALGQAMVGELPTEPTKFVMLTVAGLGAWLAVAVYAIIAWRRSVRWPIDQIAAVTRS
jgi:hypothetical protein